MGICRIHHSASPVRQGLRFRCRLKPCRDKPVTCRSAGRLPGASRAKPGRGTTNPGSDSRPSWARRAPRRIRCPRRIKAGSNALQDVSLDPQPSLVGRSARGVPLPAGLSDAKVSLVALHRNIRVTKPATHLTRCQLTTTFSKRNVATVRRSRLRGGFSIIDEPRGHDVGPDGEWVERYECRADAASS